MISRTLGEVVVHNSDVLIVDVHQGILQIKDVNLLNFASHLQCVYITHITLLNQGCI